MRRIVRKVDKSRAEWTVRKMNDFYVQNKFILENAVQRGFEWSKDPVRMSEFIYSLIIERPIPPIYVAKIDGKYSAMDGKQRATTIHKFLNDEFPLEGLEPLEVYDSETDDVEEVDINTLYFSELEETIQDAIKDSTLTVIIINDPTEDEMCEYFYYLNNGVALNSITSSRARAKSRETIKELGGHELFKNALTAKALEKYTNEDIVVKSYAMIHVDEPSFDRKSVENLMVNADITDDDKAQMQEIFDRILSVHGKIEDKRIARKILVRTHMISIVPVIWQSLQDGLSDEQVTEWFSVFFNGKRSTTISETYNSNARGSTGKKIAIKRRVEALMDNYNEFFKGKPAA